MTEDDEDNRPLSSSKKRAAASVSGRKSAFDVIADTQFNLVLNGVTRSLDPEEALQQKTFLRGVGGDVRAAKTVYAWIEEREAIRIPTTSRLPTFKAECAEPIGVDEALQLLGVATSASHDLQRNGRPILLLSADAINAAIARQKTPLKRHDREEVQSQAADPDQIDWRGEWDD